MATRVTHKAMQIHGGNGYLANLECVSLWATGLSALFGVSTNNIRFPICAPQFRPPLALRRS
jgi:alkylation response protein AidB-like acyl-CoA dehydrogenase